MLFEKIDKGIYICNSKLLFIRFDALGESLYLKNDEEFINMLNLEMERYEDINLWGKIDSINPLLATSAEINLSNNCNMECLYCYSHKNRNCETLSFTQAKAIIDRLISNSILKNIKKRRKNKINLCFHGGGEPSYEKELLFQVVEYAIEKTEKHNMELELHISTNLSLEDIDLLDFYIKNKIFVHVSMDGIEEVQNYQRPYIDGGKSYKTVMNNLEYISRNNAIFSVRLTVTDYSIDYVMESVKLIKENFPNVRFIKLGALENTDQAEKSGIGAPDLLKFFKVQEEVDRYLDEKFEFDEKLFCGGMCSTSKLEQIGVSPEGILNICHENPLAEGFYYGKVTRDGTIEIDEEKVKKIKNDREQQITKGSCSNCEYRYICKGGCISRSKSKSKGFFCAQMKKCLKQNIHEMFENPEISKSYSRKVVYKIGDDIITTEIVSFSI